MERLPASTTMVQSALLRILPPLHLGLAEATPLIPWPIINPLGPDNHPQENLQPSDNAPAPLPEPFIPRRLLGLRRCPQIVNDILG